VEKIAGALAFLPDKFLARLAAELDADMVTAIILHGSYARGEGLPLYSDVDLVRIIDESADHREEKRFLYREGYLLSVSSRPLSAYRKRLTQPEKAIFAVPGVREARILLDKNGEFQKFQQEAWEWTWEPLQTVADAYASQLMVEQTEIVLKLLRALALQDLVALSEMILDLFAAITDAVAVQRGVLVRSGNTYFRQVQESVGQQSVWTHYHLRIAGVTTYSLSLKERSREVLCLYKETAQLLKPHIHSDHWSVIEQTIYTIGYALSDEEIS
jgi:predicted nucleotidyltransferase